MLWLSWDGVGFSGVVGDSPKRLRGIGFGVWLRCISVTGCSAAVGPVALCWCVVESVAGVLPGGRRWGVQKGLGRRAGWQNYEHVEGV